MPILSASSHICTALYHCVSHCTHSFKQQSQWIILSSICYCMAEGSRAVHPCPATCLHHRARAGRDSVCQCLQWSDYAPVLRHVQSSSVCSLSSAAVYICLCGGGCGDDTSAWVGSTEAQVTSLRRHLHNSNECKGTFHNSSYHSIRYVSGAAAATVFCSSGRRGKGRGKKTLRSADSVLHAIPKGPSEKGERGKKGKVKGVGDRKTEGKKHSPTICGKRITQGLSVT